MYLLLSVITGMVFIIVKSLSMLLSKHVGIYKSNVVNHITGLFGTIMFALLFLRQSSFQLEDLSHVGIFPLLGGVLGATFVALSNYTFSKTKVLISTLLILVGQTIAAITLDYIYDGKMISVQALFGTLLIIIAVFLYNEKESTITE